MALSISYIVSAWKRLVHSISVFYVRTSLQSVLTHFPQHRELLACAAAFHVAPCHMPSVNLSTVHHISMFPSIILGFYLQLQSVCQTWFTVDKITQTFDYAKLLDQPTMPDLIKGLTEVCVNNMYPTALSTLSYLFKLFDQISGATFQWRKPYWLS